MGAHLKHYISGNPTLFPDDTTKVTFAVSYLRGPAFKWYEPHLHREIDPIRHNFDLFVNELIKNLGDPDRLRNLTKELQNLRQTGSAADYMSKFYQVSAFLEWNDQALRGQYYTGLKADVKDALAYVNEDPASLKDLSDLAIRLDNRIHDRKMDKLGGNTNRSSFERASGGNQAPATTSRSHPAARTSTPPATDASSP